MNDLVENPKVWHPAKGIVENSWHRVEQLEGIAQDLPVLLTLEQWLASDAQALVKRPGKIAVELAPGDSLEKIENDLACFDMIALSFPAYSDGRSYSKAQLLRSHHGFKGTIRATGEVLIDQVSHMVRVGFDELEISHEVTLQRIEAGRTGGLDLYYQPTAITETKTKGYSWRRLPVA